MIENGWFLPWDRNHLLLELLIRNKEQLGNISPLQEIDRIKDLRFIPVIAHPERYIWLKTEELMELCRYGALLQVTSPSLAGRYGEEVKQRATTLISNGHVSFYGTDLHSQDYVRGLDCYFGN